MEDINDAECTSISSQTMDKNCIPELTIPTFETVPSEDSESVSTNKPMISPDNLSGSTNNTTESSNENDLKRSNSPPNPTSSSQLENMSAASSPSNPSAPLTSPDKSEKAYIAQETKKNSPPPLSPPPLPNGASAKLESSVDSVLNNLNGPPMPIGQRGRVVSLDRGRYMNNHNLNAQKLYTDDDDLSASSIGSSDGEGSYFSEHLPSPPRRRESVGSSNPRLLPPGAGSNNSRANNNSIHMPKLHSQNHFAASHESDLSLSSSSSEEDYNRKTNHLANAYPMDRTHSAPVQGSSLKPRIPSSNQANSSYYSDNQILTHHDTIDDYLNLPLPKNARRFPSTSSLVSSSSEDVERKHKSSGKHRRQSSCRSVGSITSAGSALLPEKPTRFDNNDDSDLDNEPTKPPELVSFPGNRHGKSSTSKRSPYDLRRLPRNRPFNDSPKNQPLSEDQLNAWRNGMVRNDSYVSSSNGNNSCRDTSPDKASKNAEISSLLSNHSKSASSHQSKNGSGIFVYSEDDTDESARHRGIDDGAGNEAASASGSEQPSTMKRNRSFGKDITNKDDIAPTGRNAQINPSPDRRSNRLGSTHPSMSPGKIHDSSHLKHFNGGSENASLASSKRFKVYWKRWLMLFYMSLLNLLSDWTCFSVAPIALLMTERFQNINPEHLVTIFLFANTISTVSEPILLARLGLRRTIVFGSFLLMFGNVIKSGGIPGIIGDGVQEDYNIWRLYVGFFLVGLSQPLYQCTPSILSSSWFPEKERTVATGIALNSNQLGIGCSFAFGSLLVVSSTDIPNYFGLLSILSTLVFIGCYLQFQDAPPTPPSETARVMRGSTSFSYFNMQENLPQYFRMFQGGMGYEQVDPRERMINSRGRYSSAGSSESRSSLNRESESFAVETRSSRKSRRSDRRDRGSPTGALRSNKPRSRRLSTESNNTRSMPHRQRSHGSRSHHSDARSRRSDTARGHLPSPAIGTESTEDVISTINTLENEAGSYGAIYPSPMMQGRVRQHSRRNQSNYGTPQRYNDYSNHQSWHYTPYGSETPGGFGQPYSSNHSGPYYNDYEQYPDEQGGAYPETPFPNLRYAYTPSTSSAQYSSQIPVAAPYEYNDTPMQYYHPMADPRFLHHRPPTNPEYYHYQHPMHSTYQRPPQPPIYPQPTLNPLNGYLPGLEGPDEGVEPIVSHAGSFLSIDIRDDQIFRSIRACFSRPGFLQTVIAFAVSGIVLNTISTYTDSLLSLIGAGRGTVGFVGVTFQVLVMISSMIIGRITDKRRAYYCVVICLLLMGAFTLAECAINLEAGRGSSLAWTLLLLAVFVGPLQPVATELGVEV